MVLFPEARRALERAAGEPSAASGDESIEAARADARRTALAERREEVAEVRGDAIMATGRSDYPNQVNNVLGFPYIFRGALDVRATTINEEMKIAAAEAIAALAREDVPDEVAAAYRGARPVYGPEYIIPSPFDPRLISRVSAAVAEASKYYTAVTAEAPAGD